MLQALTGGFLGVCDEATVEAYRAACHERFSNALAFLKQVPNNHVDDAAKQTAAAKDSVAENAVAS